MFIHMIQFCNDCQWNCEHISAKCIELIHDVAAEIMECIHSEKVKEVFVSLMTAMCFEKDHSTRVNLKRKTL